MSGNFIRRYDSGELEDLGKGVLVAALAFATSFVIAKLLNKIQERSMINDIRNGKIKEKDIIHDLVIKSMGVAMYSTRNNPAFQNEVKSFFISALNKCSTLEHLYSFLKNSKFYNEGHINLNGILMMKRIFDKARKGGIKKDSAAMVNYSLAKKISQLLSMYAVPFIGEANRIRLIQLSRDLTVQVSMKNDTAIEQLLKEIKSAIKGIVKSSLVDEDYFDTVNESITKCRKIVSVSLKADKIASEDANKEKISRYINAICEFNIDVPKFSIMSNSIRQIGERYEQALTTANNKPQIQRALHGMTESIKRIIDPVIQELKKMITGERMQGKFFKKKLMKIVAMTGNVVSRA